MRWVVSLLLLGVVGIVLGSSTLAYFSDIEESKGNYIAAGTLNLTLYNVTEGTKYDGKNLVMFKIDNRAPGDSGSYVLKIKNEGSLDGILYINFSLTSNDDNGCTEPEKEAGDNTCGSKQGELAQYLLVTIKLDNEVLCEDTPLKDLPTTLKVTPLASGEEKTMTVSWRIPVDLTDENGGDVNDNIIQSDSVGFNFEFKLVQPVGQQ